MFLKRCLSGTAGVLLLTTSAVSAEKLEHIAVVGAQFGDEGKGKFTDLFAAGMDIVVRYNGGNNAGHTVIVGDRKFAFRSLPSGVVRSKTLNIIGNGAIVNPRDLIQEIEENQKKGLALTPKQLLISENAPLILSLHKQIDIFREQQKAKSGHQLGTTGNGIGPGYEDKVARRAIRAGDLLWIDQIEAARTTLRSKVKRLVDDHYPELQSFLAEGLAVEKKGKDGKIVARYDAKELYADKEALIQALEKELLDFAPKFNPYVSSDTPIWSLLTQADQQKKRILFEGGQAVLLDIDHGTYPYVTSSSTLGTSIFPGSGFSTKTPVHVLGVAKAYMTRVGAGPFPSKMEDELAEIVRTKGHEFGTVTGRTRDIGWLDLVALKQAVTVGGITSLVLTKVDILDGFKQIKVVTEYRYHDKPLSFIPTQSWMWNDLKPVTLSLPGWAKTENLTRKEALPQELLALVSLIEEYVGVPVSIISTGAERENNIILDSRFEF